MEKGNEMGSKISEVMSNDVCSVQSSDSIATVAKVMADKDMGFLPVVEGQKLVGAVTDRDIVVRGLAKDQSVDVSIKGIMSSKVKSVSQDDDFTTAVKIMSESQMRRLPVVDGDSNLVGVISLADAAREKDPAVAGAALSEVTQPGGSHAN